MLDMVLHCRHHKINLLRSRAWGYLTIARLLGKASLPPVGALWVGELEPGSTCLHCEVCFQEFNHLTVVWRAPPYTPGVRFHPHEPGSSSASGPTSKQARTLIADISPDLAEGVPLASARIVLLCPVNEPLTSWPPTPKTSSWWSLCLKTITTTTENQNSPGKF